MGGFDKSTEAANASRDYSWTSRQLSYWAAGLLCIGLIALALAFISYALQEWFSFGEMFPPLQPVLDLTWVYAGTGVMTVLMGAIWEAVSKFKIPPPTWRVRIELERALIDLGILNGEDTRRWRGVWWCARFGKYDRKTKLYTLNFDCRTVKNKQDVYEQIEQSVAGFRYCQDVEIRPYYRKGKRRGMQLMLWYSENPYKRGLRDMSPW